MANAVFVSVVLIRFFLPLFIPKYPLPAILGCLVVDAADQSIFQAFTDDPLPGYQSYDKALDVFYLAIAYISTMRSWRDPAAFELARFLYLYRLVGVALFELLDQRWLLLVFPNTFEYFFIAYEFVRTMWNPRRMSALALVTTAAAIWIFVKLPQEWWIHIAQLDFTDFMADHPYMWIVLGVLALAVAIMGWVWRHRIPSRDWSFTVAVDRHFPTEDVELTGHEPFFTPVLLEKTVFLALISVIFAQVLPDIRASNLGLVVGVTVLVVLNAAISQWLRRRGRSWSNSAVTFLAMLAINTGIVLVDSLFGPRGDEGRWPNLSTLFIVVLLSLLIALFDRYRATRAPIAPGPGLVATVREQWADRRARHELESKDAINGSASGRTSLGALRPRGATLRQGRVHPVLPAGP